MSINQEVLGLPYAGLRVLDFGQYVAGPATAMMFADQGAEVIRIDYTDGNRWDGEILDALNRRKKSIALDLKKSVDLEIAKRLIMTADLLIENFRPGVMERLGLGYEEAHRLNDRLIYLSIPGFSSRDDKLADVKAWEEIIAAVSGQYTDMGLNRILMGINPSFTPLTLASAYACALGGMGAAAALVAREKHGAGDYIEIPIASALMEGLVYNSMYVDGYPDRYCSPRELEISRRRKADIPLNMKYDELVEFLDPFYRTYFCKDGRSVYLVCASQKTHSHTALKLLGLYDEAIEAGFPQLDDWYLPTSEWPEGVDCALGLYPISRKWADWLAPKMKAKFLEKTSKEWEDIFGQAGCPLARLLTCQEWINSEHPQAAGLIHEIDHPTKGHVRQLGAVAWVDSSAALAATPAPPPAIDGAREEILGSVKNAAPIRTGTVHPGTPWLDGVHILDMTNVIAGPMVAGTLVRFGPQVIKLDGVTPTFDPWNTIAFGLFAGQNKRSLLADVKTEDGREVLKKLIAWADIITYNGLPHQFEKLGINLEHVQAINPRCVVVKVDAWSGPKPGPRSNYPGYDDLAQAATGVMSRFGGGMNTPEEHAHMGTIDVLCGHFGGFSAMVALYQAIRTGRGQMAYTSLASAGQMIAAPFMYDYKARAPFNEPSGRDTKGWHSLRRNYEASNGWFFLRVEAKELAKLEGIPEFTGISAMLEDGRTAYLEGLFKTEPVEHWLALFKDMDIGAARLGTLTELRLKNNFDACDIPYQPVPTYQFINYNDHPCGKKVSIFAPCAIRPCHAAISVMHPTPKYGCDTVEILLEFGYSMQEVEQMLEKRVVSCSWSRDYMPD